jgi:hypothetical protein
MKKSPNSRWMSAAGIRRKISSAAHVRVWALILLAILVSTVVLSSAKSFTAFFFGNAKLTADASNVPNLDSRSGLRAKYLTPTLGQPASGLSLLQEPSGPVVPRIGPAVVPDKPDYKPGETANIIGDGFQPNEIVTLQIKHSDGTAEGGEGHEPWSVTTDENGRLSATWLVNSDDSAGSSFLLTANAASGAHAEYAFTDLGIPPGGTKSRAVIR